MEEKSIYEILYYIFLSIVSLGTLSFSVISFIINFKQNNKRIEEEQIIKNNMEKNKRDQEKNIESIKLENQKEIQELISKNEAKIYVTQTKYNEDLKLYSEYIIVINDILQSIHTLSEKIIDYKFQESYLVTYKELARKIIVKVNEHIVFLNTRAYLIKIDMIQIFNSISKTMVKTRDFLNKELIIQSSITQEKLKIINDHFIEAKKNLKKFKINDLIREHLSSLELK